MLESSFFRIFLPRGGGDFFSHVLEARTNHVQYVLKSFFSRKIKMSRMLVAALSKSSKQNDFFISNHQFNILFFLCVLCVLDVRFCGVKTRTLLEVRFEGPQLLRAWRCKNLACAVLERIKSSGGMFGGNVVSGAPTCEPSGTRHRWCRSLLFWIVRRCLAQEIYSHLTYDSSCDRKRHVPTPHILRHFFLLRLCFWIHIVHNFDTRIL